MTGIRLLLAAGLAAAALAPAGARAHSLVVVWHPPHPRPGDAAWVHVKAVAPDATVEGSVDGRPLSFFPYAQGQAAVAGFDLEAKPGSLRWHVAVLRPGQEPQTAQGQLRLRGRDFAVQRLTLPPAMVNLDPQTERRAEEEGERLRTAYRMISPDRLWRGRFARPVGGAEPGAGFGARRIINGQPRAPHGGIDFAAPAGSPVVAANDGRVALVGEYFFPGRFVIVDHGLGLYTLYFHLEMVTVGAGERVTRGQPIGTVGATGRATGPHLHFGAQLGTARVDPASLLELSIAD